MTHRRPVRLAALLLSIGCTPDDRPASSPDAGCEEPDPRDPKGLGEGEPCDTSFQCNSANLVCLGIGPDRRAVCTTQTEYTDPDSPEVHYPIWDPGCVDDPIEASIGHCDDADLVDSIEIDDTVGCAGTLRIYEIPDTCCPDAEGRCRFDCTDYVRHEVWRNCGCCWRMVQLVEVMPQECR